MILMLEIILYSMAAVGALVVLAIGAWFGWQFWKYICRGTYDFAERYGIGSYVAITGATDGLGKAYALYFNSKGFKIILIARNATKLTATINELALAQTLTKPEDISARYQSIVCDFTQESKDQYYATVSQKLKGQDISILINNVGIGEGGKFEDMTNDQIRNSLVVNTFPQAFLTHGIVQQMNSRKNADGTAKKAAIINISSVGALQPVPGVTVYVSTKSFNDQFSESLAEEYWGSLDILSVTPGFIKTNMTQDITDNDHWYVLEASKVAEASLCHLGKSTSTFGHWKHALKWLMGAMLPRCCVRKSVFKFYSDLAAKKKAPVVVVPPVVGK